MDFEELNNPVMEATISMELLSPGSGSIPLDA